MELIFSKDVNAAFEKSWKKYVAIVLQYTQSHQSPTKDLTHACMLYGKVRLSKLLKCRYVVPLLLSSKPICDAYLTSCAVPPLMRGP